MKIKSLKAAIRQIKKEQEIISKARDRLRELRYEVEELEDNATQGIDDLEVAIDKLSELV